MTILVVSDSHGRRGNIDRAVKLAGGADMCVHLGDHASDGRYLERVSGKPTHVVKGNCDMSDEPAELVFEAGGRRFFITHGHKYNVKFTLDRLIYRARELAADAVLFGHTHIPCEETEEGLFIFNPGSAAYPHNRFPTFAIITVDGEIAARHISIR